MNMECVKYSNMPTMQMLKFYILDHSNPLGVIKVRVRLFSIGILFCHLKLYHLKKSAEMNFAEEKSTLTQGHQGM